jgi:hypothetical protein
LFKRTFTCIALSLCAAHAAVTINAPAAGSSVASPFRVDATSSLNRTKQMQAFLDGTLVATSTSSTGLVATVNAAAGTHTLKVVATTRNGSISQASETFNITAVSSSTGSTSTTTTSTTYGNVGDPYQGAAANPSAIPVTGCMTLSSNASYRVLNNIGTDPTTTCLKITGANTVLDLGGYSVTGRINGLGYPDINGVVVFNGKVTCNHADNQGDVGCLVLTTGAVFVKPARVHHLTIVNANSRSDMGGRAIHLVWDYRQATGDLPAIVVDHVTTDLVNAGGSRNYNVSVVASANVVLSYNSAHCPGGNNACQAFMCYNTTFCAMHDNSMVLSANTTGDLARGLLFDKVQGGEAWNNVVISNNNRALRIRDSHNVRAHNNVFKNITAGFSPYTGQIAAIHLADPDAPNFDASMNVEIDHNSLEMNGGAAVMIRGGNGITFHDNTFTSISGGYLAHVRYNAYGVSQIDLLNNPSAATVLPAAQTTLETGTAATLCNSGTTSGAGSVTYSCQ